ncbi:P-loop containing nucleoside triphosphate hydrolase protein [Coniophora puteana RWD-64-598 SS2]|uniref:P-loop containing nucleoside triphosphate hydrolase protein n=1 Tax=Coniophora puteana (strain RWD-64-598) TaxID=741705 RepID=A0A5M3MNT7_CONPW|nr:P-loop containing nucleoside triphosphate hydrolase protein [Coniophora puteana RWD-64-598 SS2]EIW80395.1 P-loop containing nucleoside triphosphate hydrolase protein [Coniophora puteana RWD-64-598 SS2]
MGAHVLRQLARHRASFTSSEGSIGTSSRPVPPPLFVGVQGPQGSGKTFLTSSLASALSREPHSLRTAVLSIDDLYLPFSGLQAVSAENPGNLLLQGRGQPGTHDVPLGSKVLAALKSINELGAEEVELPVFDKSLHGGKGDRLPEGSHVHGPLDIVLLEGWCVGFAPLPGKGSGAKSEDVRGTTIGKRWREPVPSLGHGDELHMDMEAFVKEERYVWEVNERLKEYVEWWKMLDAFVQIRGPEDQRYRIIYKWRMQQEHYMMVRNGGKGMKDDEIKNFVDRYIPGYVFFGDGVTEGWEVDGVYQEPPWKGRGLAISLGENREMLRTDYF